MSLEPGTPTDPRTYTWHSMAAKTLSEILPGIPRIKLESEHDRLLRLIRSPNVLRQPAQTPDQSDPPPQYIFRKRGDMWEVKFQDEAGNFKDTLGFKYIARLLTTPGKPISAVELHGVDLGTMVSFAPDKAVDNRARKEYEHKLEDFDDLIEQATDSKSYSRVEELQEQRDALVTQMALDTGLGGKSRPLGTTGPAKSAQTSVQRSITAALNSVTKAMPRAGEHLTAGIRTGADCTYQPITTPIWSLD